jgi:hypothetical protein
MHPLRAFVLASFFLASITLSLSSSASIAGTIEPALDAELSSLPPGGEATALVILKDQAPIGELDHSLSARDASRAERHETIVRALQETAQGSQRDLRASMDAALRAGEITRYRTYWILNAALVLGTADAIRAIAARPDVAQVRSNPHPTLISPVGRRDATENLRGIGVTPGQRAIGSDRVWRELGITGAGRIVSELDTGVDGNHPALHDRWRGNNGHPWQECWLDLLGGSSQYPYDSAQHGTHTMGTLTGMSSATGDTIGVAWGAQWIECNVIGQGAGGNFDADVLTAFQWIADPDGNPATVTDVPDVCQNSWRVNTAFGYPPCFDLWWGVIDNCEAAGCAVTFSAGNEGPGSSTIGSPPDRATTPTNAFAVGAVDATNYSWPYPIAGFSSRGPSDCPGGDIKPEVSAPGVDVYSSIPGGGYAQSGWSGTSMAGPHAAGIIALMREANPDLDVTTMKQIMLDTARDEGTAGNDNDYGYGFVDAYAAVTIALQGTGVLQGSVSNVSNGGTPIPGVFISLRGSAAQYPTESDGRYHGHALGGSYMAVASHPSFAPDSALVVITANGVATQNFSLRDIAPPVITNVSDPGMIPDAVGPYAISATLTDMSAIGTALLWYRVQSGSWINVPMSANGNVYTGLIPGSVAGSRIDFYVTASDVAGNGSSFPPDAPTTYLSLYVTVPILIDDAETDHHWTIGWPGDTATHGFWVREDPVGTHVGQELANPEDDHTPDPGHICFVTEDGPVGGNAGANDVDGGCTSLVTPTLNLAGVNDAFISYWRWYAQFGIAGGDNFTVQVSNNNGLSWVDVESVTSRQNRWTENSIKLSDYVSPTAMVRLRFRACDLQTDSVVEGAVDDVRIETLPALPTGVDEGPLAGRTSLGAARPNPMRTAARVSFRLASPTQTSLDLYDAAGRHVRTLLSGHLDAGPHEANWDGRDDGGSRAAPGVYFYRLRASGFEESSRIVLVP